MSGDERKLKAGADGSKALGNISLRYCRQICKAKEDRMKQKKSGVKGIGKWVG
nr:hypothetical protein [Sulfolobus sp. NOB8H2]